MAFFANPSFFNMKNIPYVVYNQRQPGAGYEVMYDNTVNAFEACVRFHATAKRQSLWLNDKLRSNHREQGKMRRYKEANSPPSRAQFLPKAIRLACIYICARCRCATISIHHGQLLDPSHFRPCSLLGCPGKKSEQPADRRP